MTVHVPGRESSATTPAFGQADLSNCEREQIHLAGSVQPHGALLVVREGTGAVVQASENAASFLDLSGDVIGRRVDDLPGDLWRRASRFLDVRLDEVPVVTRCRIGRQGIDHDATLHRPPGGGLVIELERSGAPLDLSARIQHALRTIMTLTSLRALCDETARLCRELTGYDRVMVYRFDTEGHGEVFSEEREPALEAYLGNRYPASDIPHIARRLYERNRIRVLVDVHYAPVPVSPRRSPITGAELDMSLCYLRSMSPIHIQYLKNMGVAATLVASLVVGGRLWGLIACHHYVPRPVQFEIRAACELLAEVVATRIAALESFAQAQAELSVRRIERRMIEAISREGDWRGALFDGSQLLLQALGATGAALLYDERVQTIGEVPGTHELRDISAWLDAKPRTPMVATASLGLDEPRFAPLTPVASGLVATPVSNTPGEYLIWFRPERVRTVTWGGNPFKPVIVGDDPADLSPRRSFSQWHQLVEGTSDPWTTPDLATARLIGDSVADVVVQFQAVRMLVAQHQLELVRGQVGGSDQPVIVTDQHGAILLLNDACRALLGPAAAALRGLDDLARMFSRPDEAGQRLAELTGQGRIWRGEVTVTTARQAIETVLVRADPVYSAPGRVLGFVLMFTDMAARKAADAARLRFQESIIDGGGMAMARRIDPTADLLYSSLLAAAIENAQLAALEITDGVDASRMPAMLEGVRTSVARTAELLEHLLRHGTGHPGR